MRCRLLMSIALCLLTWAEPALAWSELGHQLVAQLAERQLRPDTRRLALELLAAESHDSLQSIAAWADRVRDQPEYRWSQRLHFVNLPRDCSYHAERDCADGDCIVVAIARFRAEVADRSLPDTRRAEALKFLVHLVGDLHQPLHAGFADDLGGNRHQISLAGTGTNLHSIWDRELLLRSGLDRERYHARLASRQQPPTGSLDPADWARQSCALINAAALYPPRHTLDVDYFERQRPLAEAQLLLAAARLAAVLEQALGNTATDRN